MKEESNYKHCFWVLVTSIALALITLGVKGQTVAFTRFKINPIVEQSGY